MPQVTVGFVPRDRFCKAAEALERLYANTDIPFDLIFVDCNIPAPFRQAMQRVLDGRGNVQVIRTDHYLLSHQAHNLIREQNRSEYLCLMENDILVEEGCLSWLVAACEEHPADVAVPLIIEEVLGFRKIHFDDRLGCVKKTSTPRGVERRIEERAISKEHDMQSKRRPVGMIETHIVLYRRSALERIGEFDETLSSRVEVDVSLALDDAAAPMVFEPQARAIYSPPPPVYPQERDYYLYKHDVDRALRNHEHIKKKWNLVDLPDAVGFARRRRALASELDPQLQERRELEYRSMLARASAEIADLIPRGGTFILADEMQWNAKEVAKGRRPLPFLEREGQYWGRPTDDATAIRELERLRRAGASHVIFAQPALWWLDYYSGLRSYLQGTYGASRQSECLVVFDLRQRAVSPAAGADVEA